MWSIAALTCGAKRVYGFDPLFTLEKIKNDLEIKKDEQAARRDYEYEARKRLYQECEPILFQFVELSESALKRIYALARNV
jgi:hypothetical protein